MTSRTELLRGRRWRVVLASAGLLILGLLVAFAIELSDTQAKSRRDVETRVHERAVLAGALIDSLFQTVQQQVPLDEAKYGGATVTNAVMNANRQQNAYLALLDRSGRVIASSRGFTPQARANLIGSPALTLVRSGHPYGIGNVRPYGHAGVINLAVRFPTSSGERILLSGFVPSSLEPILGGELRRIPGVKGAHNYVLDGNDTVLASTNPAIRAGFRFTQPAQVQALARSSGDRNGHFYEEVRLANSTWRIVLAAPDGPLFASVSGLRKWLPWAIFIAFALVAATALALGARTVRSAERRVTRTEEDALAAAEAYRMLFETNPQAMWIFDPETLEIFEVNNAALDHYGYSREEFLGMTVKDLRPKEDIPAMIDSIGEGGIDHSGPWRHLKRDGSEIRVEVVASTVEFRGRRGRFVMATDVTDRERLQRQLAQVQRLESLGQLAGGVAHDFNNLLAVILNYTRFVGEEVGAAALQDDARWAPVASDIEEIERAADRATGLTRQLLAFARREVIHPEVVNLNDVVAETEQLLRRTLGEHIELTSTLADDLDAVLADPGQLEQVLVNLAVNARDAMPEGGTLAIETGNVTVDSSYASSRPDLTPGPYVRLRVSDSGVGMDAGTVEHAFEPFFSTKPKGEGTGLGLATIYGIVSQSGGQVRLYSEPGVGTTCTIMLPATEQTASAQAPEVEREPGGRGEVVLMVEDESGIREVASRILTRRGYHVLTAADGTEAIELARGHDGPIDLLMTDVIMPGMLGKEVASCIREMRPTVRVMFMSGYAQPILDKNSNLPEGMILLEKPFTEPTLLAKVREALASQVS